MTNLFAQSLCSAVIVIFLGTVLTFGQKGYNGSENSQNAFKTTAQTQKSLTKYHEQIARQYFKKVWNNGDLSLLDQLLAENYTIEKPTSGLDSFDINSKKSFISEFRKAFPDARFKIEELRSSEDSVLVRVTVTGTHRGAFQGIEPTGKRIKVDQMQLKRFDNGKIVFHTQILDDQQLVAQLIEE